MPTAEHCRAMAAEADRLASLVSYTRDKDRLREQAKTWRHQAETLDANATAHAAQEAEACGAGLMGWLRRRVG